MTSTGAIPQATCVERVALLSNQEEDVVDGEEDSADEDNVELPHGQYNEAVLGVINCDASGTGVKWIQRCNGDLTSRARPSCVRCIHSSSVVFI